MTQVAKWRRWAITKEWNITTKRAHTIHTKWAVIKEAMLLQKLNDAWISRVPQIIETVEWWFRYPWIEWVHFDKVYNKADIPVQTHLASQLLSHAYELDTLWIIHGELQRPTANVLVNTKNKVSIIDFERWALQDFSWRNMKAVGQRLRREWYFTVEVLRELSGKKLSEIHEILTQYITLRINNQTTNSMKPWNQYISMIISLILLLTIDLVSKYLFYDLEIAATTQFLQPILNPGSARSLSVPHWITRLWAVGVSIRIWYEYIQKNIWLLASSLVVAGAIGNSIDRVVYGGVRDFIDITSLVSYPIFNIADILLVVGVIIIVYRSLRT
jgi:lipoprotein signal peptidase/predicted Ser/Thr protein kinase